MCTLILRAARVRRCRQPGRLVTSAALILFLAFISLASDPLTDVKILATALAAGTLLDATVVRGLIVSAVVSLLGRGNWGYRGGPECSAWSPRSRAKSRVSK